MTRDVSLEEAISAKRRSQLPPVAQPAPLLARLSQTDPWVFFVWTCITTFPFPQAAPLRYLLVGYFAASLVLFARDTLPTYARAWPTLLLPILCVISAAWAPSLSDAVRKGVFLGLTGAIAVYAASRMSSRQIMSAVFLGGTLGAALSLINPTPVHGNWTGVFGQKNFLAVHMFIMYVAGFSVLLDRQANPWLRLWAIIFVPLGGLIIFMTNSATNLLLMLAATTGYIGYAFIWTPAARFQHMRTLIVLGAAVLVLSLALILFGLFQIDLVEELLAAVGKDSTLTGRTYLWDIARRIMAEKPLTGVGAEGFWRPEVGAARSITSFFSYGTFTKFSFHNSFLENGVHLGYPGYYATYLVAGWGLLFSFRNWLIRQTPYNFAFAMIAVVVILRANTEADLAGDLSSTAILLFIGAARKETPPLPGESQSASEPPRGGVLG
jgi:exopolysaccharide production protein ExoQ